MKTILIFPFLLLSFFCTSQKIDNRILKHYSDDQILSMSSEKLELVKYYYLESYILDTTAVSNFKIDDFDISKFEDSRDDDEYIIIDRKDGLRITLIPNSLLIKRLYVKSYFIIN